MTVKNPQEDDAVERMLNQLEGLLKRQHDSARASRGALAPLGAGELQAPQEAPEQPAESAAVEKPTDAAEAGSKKGDPGKASDRIDGAVPAPTSNGNGTDKGEVEAYDPDATAPEMNAFDGAAKESARGALPGIEAPSAGDLKPDSGAPDNVAKQLASPSGEEARKPPKLSAVPSTSGEFPRDSSDGSHMARRLTTRLGQLLLDADLLSEAQLKAALEKQHDTGEKLGAILVNQGYIDEADLLSVLANQHGVPTAKLDNVKLDPALAQMIPADMARRYQLIPMAIGKDAIDVAMVDPTDFVAMAHVRFATGLRPNVFITTATAAARAMTRLYVDGTSEPQAPDQPRDPRAEIKKMILDRDALLIGAEQDPRKFYELAASIDRFVDDIIRKASS